MTELDSRLHKRTTSRQFTRAADAFAASPVKSDMDYRRRYVHFAAANASDAVLDVATGPGFSALAFAEVARIVVGFDITPAMLERAARQRDKARLANIELVLADVEAIPFADSSFQVVSCNSSLHHFQRPGWVFQEMARVCAPGGRVVIDDQRSSEDASRAAGQDRIERRRDPSHAHSLSRSEMLSMVREAGLEVQRVEERESTRDFDEWMKAIGADPATYRAVRQAMLESSDDDSAGLAPRLEEGGRLVYERRVVWLVAAKPLG
ncbi:MAG: methyltransferase domain-containing protein [Chloroflexota bacterium]|nr:methyltransferase domain-containing protein [Chloroflexota bacterium]